VKNLIEELHERLRKSGSNDWYSLAEIIWGDRYALDSIAPDLWQAILINFCEDEGVRVLDVPQISPANLRRLISLLPSIGMFVSIFPRLDERRGQTNFPTSGNK
jgi:hypothetical protein